MFKPVPCLRPLFWWSNIYPNNACRIHDRTRVRLVSKVKRVDLLYAWVQWTVAEQQCWNSFILSLNPIPYTFGWVGLFLISACFVSVSEIDNKNIIKCCHEAYLNAKGQGLVWQTAKSFCSPHLRYSSATVQTITVQ